jgi:hypothetical protein
MESVNAGVNEHALTQNASSFENFSDEKSQKNFSTFENFSAKTSSDFENFSDESSWELEKFCDENPTDFENFCDDKLDAWLAMEEESFHAPPPLIHLGAMDAALQKIAGLLGLPLSRCVLSLLDTILLNTTYRFRDSGGITLGVRAETLAQELGASPRTIRRLLQMIDESGYIVRGRGGEIDGVTAIRLTSRALREPTTYWVLKTKGRNISGLVEYLDAQQLRVVASKTKPTPQNTSSPTLCAEPSRGHGWPRPFSNDLKIAPSEARGARDTFLEDEPPAPKTPEPSPIIAFILTVLLEEGVSQIPDPELLKNFEDKAQRKRIGQQDLVRYIDLKLWELTDLRKVPYSANTLIKILTSDLEHWRAVITNLSNQRWNHARMEPEPFEPSPALEIEDEDLDVMAYHKPVVESGPLKPWQEHLKSQVSTGAWEQFLSLLVENEASETMELWAPEPFVGQWIIEEFSAPLTASVGPCRICWQWGGEYCATDLKTPSATSQEAVGVLKADAESPDYSEEPMEAWRVGLRDAVPDSAWRMFLRFLRREPSAEGQVILTCEDAFLAEWIADHYSDHLESCFGRPVELKSQGTSRIVVSH